MNFLIKLSGSIACYKTGDLISRLMKAGHQVQTVTSAGAEKFIGAATLEGLTGRPNLGDLWKTKDPMAHIRLPEWADAVVLCPASANTINKIAHGIGDDLLTTLFLAHDFSKPYYLAPAMNPRMLTHPSTIASLERLRSWGIHIFPTGEGQLACGDFGHGKLLDPESLFKELVRLKPTPPPEADHPGRKNPVRHILITAGGTEEPIDSVRVLSNLSSGKTGSFLADHFAGRHASVTLLRSHRGKPATDPSVKQLSFQSSADLEALLKEELATGKYDMVVHLAAISDFTVAGPHRSGGVKSGRGLPEKLSSDTPVEITLVPTPKLLPLLKKWAPADKTPIVAGFKLTDTLDKLEEDAPILSLMKTGEVDAVVHNAKESINSDKDTHPCHIHLPGGDFKKVNSKRELAEALFTLSHRKQLNPV